MPELREVFEMTTKQVEPDVDAWREQEGRQRTASRNKKVAAIAVVMATALVAVGSILWTRGQNGTTPADKPPTVAPETPAEPAAQPLGKADARITLGGVPRQCTLEVADDPITTNTLRIELVNDTSEVAMFRIGRIETGRTWPGADPERHLREVRTSFLHSGDEPRRVVRDDAAGMWGAICYGTKYDGPHSFVWAHRDFGAVGPMVVE